MLLQHAGTSDGDPSNNWRSAPCGKHASVGRLAETRAAIRLPDDWRRDRSVNPFKSRRYEGSRTRVSHRRVLAGAERASVVPHWMLSPIRFGVPALATLCVCCAGQSDESSETEEPATEASEASTSEDPRDGAAASSDGTASSSESASVTAELPGFAVEDASHLPPEGESVVFSLVNASTSSIYVLAIPSGAAWTVDGIRITHDCAVVTCPVEPVHYCPPSGPVCGLSASLAQEVPPDAAFEFEWTHEYEVLNYACDEFAGQCEQAHAIAPGEYVVSVQYGSSSTGDSPFDSVVDVTTLTQVLSFPEQRRVEFVVE